MLQQFNVYFRIYYRNQDKASQTLVNLTGPYLLRTRNNFLVCLKTGDDHMTSINALRNIGQTSVIKSPGDNPLEHE
jgi:hypothetical protein